MSHPTPIPPINVQHSNPYTGLDRGLFVPRGHAGYAVARVHAARWSVGGGPACVGRLEFQLMAYATDPVTAEQYAAGTLLTSPDGTPWFDCQTRGLVVKPIMVEYWATEIYYAHYMNEGAVKLTDEEILNANVQAKVFTTTQGRPYGIQELEYTATFNAVAGQALTLTSRALTADYDLGQGPQVLSLTEFPPGDFDPVVLAMNHIKQIKRG